MNITHPTTSSRRRTAGMTLIELMIVMVIIGILTAIAYPSYQGHTAKTRRKAAAACLSQYANFMERYYTSNLNYNVPTPPVLGCSTESDLNRFYWFDRPLIGAGARTYTITATPTPAQQSKDPDRCGPLTLDQAGGRTPNRNACW